MNLHELIDELNKIVEPNWPDRGKNLPVMCQCDHGQWPENIYSVQLFYRVRGSEDDSDFQYGPLECMLEDWGEDDLEQFIMIN
ncbi:hypothetical protein SCRM01_289 [Synechococcus phage S-CRM01]|uniref:hypothetical protein n=1 Tax=Synechococcus phage S-CRM01 TaxID=1026955 RepID=UPI000209E31D|nr:hypothetical protein SCRM01_289 [Synechococcus phage S-CRM01]AEC53235.1 hypothetical protein SCRM01_289 [Synechococcus phage S-CRM01]